MQTVGADGDRAGAPDHVALEPEQRGGQQTREQKHRDAEGALLERLRAEQAPRGLVGEEEGRPEDEARLDEGADRLGLAVAVAVRAVRRLRRLADADEGHHGRERVHAAVDQGAQNGDRAGGDPDRELGNDQDRRDGDAGDRGKVVQALRIGAQRSAPSARRSDAPPGRSVYDVRCRLAKIESNALCSAGFVTWIVGGPPSRARRALPCPNGSVRLGFQPRPHHLRGRCEAAADPDHRAIAPSSRMRMPPRSAVRQAAATDDATASAAEQQLNETPARRSCGAFWSAAGRGRPRRAGCGSPRCRSAGAD